MKKGDYCEAVVETIEFPNKGVLDIDGERVIVKNALPGQTIRFVINKEKGKCEGRLLEVLGPPSLEQTEETCPHFGICGGCLYQSLPYEEQLKDQEQQVKSLIDGVCSSYVFEGIREALCLRDTGIKWNFPLEMSSRMVLLLWECTAEGVFMIL